MNQWVRTMIAALLLAVLTVQPGWGQSGRVRGLSDQSTANADYSRVAIFGIEATGNKIVYLFDRSSSMDGPPLSAAKRQLLKSLESLGDTQQFDIIFFNQRLQVFDGSSGHRRTVFATERSKKLASRFISGVKADGGTNRVAALRHALALRPNVIFFLSDAEGPMSASELGEIAELNERVGAQICTIQFGQGAQSGGESSLAALAKANGGRYVYFDTATFTK